MFQICLKDSFIADHVTVALAWPWIDSHKKPGFRCEAYTNNVHLSKPGLRTITLPVTAFARVVIATRSRPAR